jgi:predicted transcriptional regulator of viral defense system
LCVFNISEITASPVNQLLAFQKIQELGVPSFETRDVSALLRVTRANSSALLSRLASRGLVLRISRGIWSLPSRANRALLAEHLAAPLPAYVSLQTALFQHGLIEQIPEVLYAVTLGRARRVQTPIATISFHRIPLNLFGGFTITDDGAKLATPEKAMFDKFYLSPKRTRLFVKLPEVELPKSFHWAEIARWAGKISGKNRRTFVEQKLVEVRRQLTSAVG